MAEGARSCQENVDDGGVSLEMVADEHNTNVKWRWYVTLSFRVFLLVSGSGNYKGQISKEEN